MVLVKDSEKTKDEKKPRSQGKEAGQRQGGTRLPRQPPAGLEWMERYLQVPKPQGLKHHTVLQTQVGAEI